MTEDTDRHTSKMVKKKAARDRMMAKKTDEKGLIMVHTGPGKGKTTAALGMAIRCVGHGFKVSIIQFIKGAMETAERKVLDRFPELVTIQALGEGFTWETQDREKDEAAVRHAWGEAKKHLSDPEVRMVILDELNIALRYDYMPVSEVIEALEARPEGQHVVITGRGASDELIEVADLVTEMKMVKHPFRAGVKAQAGVEF